MAVKAKLKCRKVHRNATLPGPHKNAIVPEMRGFSFRSHPPQPSELRFLIVSRWLNVQSARLGTDSGARME